VLVESSVESVLSSAVWLALMRYRGFKGFSDCAMQPVPALSYLGVKCIYGCRHAGRVSAVGEISSVAAARGISRLFQSLTPQVEH
jgi:hypothetical protein